ncbi:hypothetical protein BDR22DRAFT_856501 [Usnea florida]
MEVSFPGSALERTLNTDQDTAGMEFDSMDLDIDLGSMDEPNFNEPLPVTNTISELAVPSSQISESDLSLHKIHIRGLENLTTSDIHSFFSEHHPSEKSPRVEWIDDTSANLVFEGEEAAKTALRHLTLPSSKSDSLPISQLRAAKTLSTHPGSSLYVRIALITDQKRPRAYEASRFYMLHPEHDPREQRRLGVRRQGHGDYRRKGYSDNEHRRRRRRDKEDGFDASMYDDGGSSSRRGSISSSPNEIGMEGEREIRRRGDYYRPARDERNSARLTRDRSASPNGRNCHTPPPIYRSRDPHPFLQDNKGKELFPSTLRSRRDADRNDKDLFSSNLLIADVNKGLNTAESALARETAPTGSDLFSNRTRASEIKKELFPHKVNSNKHSRFDAFDAADETADLFANGMSMPFIDRLSRRKTPISKQRPCGLQSQAGGEDVDLGLSIRGASRADNQGFSIRGGAAVKAIGTIKELFPGKAASNSGKELFAERIEGRGARRNRAEDLFY